MIVVILGAKIINYQKIRKKSNCFFTIDLLFIPKVQNLPTLRSAGRASIS